MTVDLENKAHKTYSNFWTFMLLDTCVPNDPILVLVQFSADVDNLEART